MSVFYKFKSALTYDTIQFDDLHISLQDFKKAVIQQKQFGKNTNFDLQVTNAETNEVYTDENSLIPKNSSLILIRVPLSGTPKKTWEGADHLSKIGVLTPDYSQESPGNMIVRSADIASSNATEEEKIQAMMFQSTVDYDPANYTRVRGGNQFGEVPPNYTCHKCDRKGHWIKDCPIGAAPDIKKSSGIPLSFMTPVDDPTVDGALMTPSGTFAVPTIDMQAYKEGKKEKPFIPFDDTETPSVPAIPEDLQCSLCKDLLIDAVMMSCCAESFCDECIRNALLESEDNQCPECKETEISPEKLIPCLYLRKRVNAFKNDSSYSGNQRTKAKVAEPSKPAVIDHDQDVEIIETVSVEPSVKVEQEGEGEKGNAIVVLGSGQRGGSRIQTNGSSKLPTIHVEHRPPQGRPIGPADAIPKDTQRAIIGNGVRSSPDSIRDMERNKSSPSVVNVSHPSAVVNRLTGLPPVMPNMSQLPPGYSQPAMQPLGAHFGGNVPPMMPSYGPPPGVNPMVVPPHLPPQSPSVRMYPPYTGQSGYSPQMGGGYRGMPGHHRMRMHHPDAYSDRNLIDDPLELFERHLREKDKQDRMRRNRSRRTRSRSPRVKSRSRSRQRSRSRSPSKKRSHSKSPPMSRKDSPKIKRDSRSPGLRRSKSKSRSRTRLRSRSRSLMRNSLPRSKSRTPIPGSKKKRSISISPPPGVFKKRSRSPSPLPKKAIRSNRSRSRTRSRSRSKSVSRARKRRRSRSRSRSVSSRRSISRGRSYSRSISPRQRAVYSPGYTHRAKRHSRSPSRHHFPARHRGGGYRDSSPYQAAHHYESNEYRGYKRGGRNSRFSRGYGRYAPNQDYDAAFKYDRYGGNVDRYEDKRLPESSNIRAYYGNSNEHSKARKPQQQQQQHYYQPPNEYEQFAAADAYNEVAPPGTVDVLNATSAYGTLIFNDNPHSYNDRVTADKYRRTPDRGDDRNSYASAAKSSNYKESPQDEYAAAKRSRDYDRGDKEHDPHRRRSSRDRHPHHRTSSSSHYSGGGGGSERDKSRTHGGSRGRVTTSTSPPETRRGRRSRARSADKENSRPGRGDRPPSGKRDSVESVNDERRSAAAMPSSSDKQASSVVEAADKTKVDTAAATATFAAVDEKKEERKDKKEKSKKKKKKDSEADKKKKKKPKTGKKEEDDVVSKVDDEPKPTKKDQDQQQQQQQQEKIITIEEGVEEVAVEKAKNDLYGDIDDTKVDTKIIENYGKIGYMETERAPKNEHVILAAVPELSKWERDDVPSPSDDFPKMSSSKSSAGTTTIADDKKMVTSEILKRAENALFQKAIKATTRVEPQKTDAAIAAKEKDDVQLIENAREARKSGNSIQVTVPASKSEDENHRSSAPAGRISAKDRLGAKVDDRNFASSAAAAVRSLVEPKTKPRSLQSTVKSVVDAKHVSKAESSRSERCEKAERSDRSERCEKAERSDRSERYEKLEKKEEPLSSKKHEDRRKKEGRHSDGKHSKRRESKDKERSKHSRKSSEEEIRSRKESAKEIHSVKAKSKDEAAFVDGKKDNTPPVGKQEEKTENRDSSDVKSLLDKKRPCLDEASFEPDYDLTSESEGEIDRKVRGGSGGGGGGPESNDVAAKKLSNAHNHETKSNIEKALIQKMMEHTGDAATSSDSSTDSSSESSGEHKKRKKRKSKKRKKTKKRKTYSSESESEESSDSDSDSDATTAAVSKHKKKKKHRHKTKKSKSAKKKKKSKHR